MIEDLVKLTSSDEIHNRGLEQISPIIVVVSRPSGNSQAIIEAKRKNYPKATAFMSKITDIGASHIVPGSCPAVQSYGVVYAFVFYAPKQTTKPSREK